MSLIMAIGSESVKVKSRKLSQMSFHENFTPRNFLAIQYKLVFSDILCTCILVFVPDPKPIPAQVAFSIVCIIPEAIYAPDEVWERDYIHTRSCSVAQLVEHQRYICPVSRVNISCDHPQVGLSSEGKVFVLVGTSRVKCTAYVDFTVEELKQCKVN